MNPQEIPQNIITAPTQSKTSLKLPIIAALILAIGGIGFGVFGIVSAESANKEVIELKNTIAQQKDELERFANGDVKTEEEITKNENGETTKTIIKTITEKSSSDYIYIGEWGIKIKKPSNLGGISYIYNADGSIGIWGTEKGGQYAPDFADPAKNVYALGRMYRATNDSECKFSQLVFSREDYNYCYSHPQAIYSMDKDEDEKDWELKSASIVQNMLTDKNNFEQF